MVERLKTGFISAQKEIGEGDKKNKKLEREIKELRAETKKLVEAGDINLNYPKLGGDDLINENPVTNHNNMEYSKYFS